MGRLTELSVWGRDKSKTKSTQLAFSHTCSTSRVCPPTSHILSLMSHPATFSFFSWKHTADTPHQHAVEGTVKTEEEGGRLTPSLSIVRIKVSVDVTRH